MPERLIEFVAVLGRLRLLWIQTGHVVFIADAEFIRSWREGRP